MWYLKVTLLAVILFTLGYYAFVGLRKDESLTCSGCNVILISIDTLGHDHLSLYNDSLDTSPFLESLAKKSFVFDNAFSQAPWTLPSHVAMLTGAYPWEHNIWIPSDVLSKDAHTIAEQLNESGYQTAAFSNGAFVRPGWALDQGFDEFYGSVQEDSWEDVPEIFDESLAWIGARTADTPYFLLLRPFETHDPYIENDESVTVQEIASENLRTDGPRDSEVDRFRNTYQSEIRKTDGALKDFFEKLEDSGKLENTIVIITSDHGEEFNEHGTAGFHAVTLYREVLHVPLIIYTPSERSARITDTVEVRSIPATILELVGLPKNLTIAQSLVSRMEGIFSGDALVLSATALERNTLLNNFANGYGALGLVPTPRDKPFTEQKMLSALRGEWHVIKNRDATVSAFNIRIDKAEQQPLTELPAEVRELTKELEKL